MSNPNVIEKKPVSMSELKAELQKIQERDEELGFRAGKTQEYINSFKLLKIEDYEKFKKELEELNIPRLKDDHIVKILDFLPRSVEDLEVLLQGYPITISKDNLKKIVDVISSAKRG